MSKIKADCLGWRKLKEIGHCIQDVPHLLHSSLKIHFTNSNLSYQQF